METQSKIMFWHRKISILAVCGLASVLFVLAVNAEDMHREKKENIQAPPVVPPETNRSAKVIKTVSLPELTKHELKIEAALNTETECNFSETPLSKAMEVLAERHGIQILIIPRGLAEEGLTVNVPVSLQVKGISLKHTLNLMLAPNELTYVVNQDVLKITTRLYATDDPEYQLRVYPVGDFGTTTRDKDGNTSQDYSELIQLIQTAILPHDDSISLVSSSKALVIETSYHNHVKIVELLTQLRRARQDQKAISKDKK